MTSDTKNILRRIVDGDNATHISVKKHRSRFLFVTAAISIIVAIVLSICLGPTGNYSPVTAMSALISAILAHGQNLDPTELIVYNLRLPRTLAAIGVGMGLAVAGAAYQAIIRNPLVDPYIMGVSAGAGTAAISTFTFEFTFFGLMSAHSPYLVAAMAMIGGLLAFGLTMLLAEKAGGTTNSYVLSGVIVGLIFSAIQTVFIIFAGDQLNNALLWLFGSFSSVTYNQAIPVFVGSLFLCLLLLKWAKEFNLILLGEEQAKQMGLNAHRFSMIMLILASVLTALCVAFCGIIGFVGLVVPHLCRMVFGGDHRLILPASIAFGAAMMVLADIAARMLYSGFELPVGAITTIVGVPVFAYLLFKRGKIYNG